MHVFCQSFLSIEEIKQAQPKKTETRTHLHLPTTMSALQYGAMPGTLVAGVLGCILPYLTSNMEKEIRGTVLVRGNAFAAGGKQLLLSKQN